MIWFTWRQFRTQTWITVGALAALGVLLVITARSIADAYDAANLAGCGNDCTTAIDNFLREVKTGISRTVFDLATVTMTLVPALIGIFWGAPLIARELETGTHRLAWNQSITRTRWLATKLAVIGAATATTVGLLSWAITAWARRIDQATGDRITPLLEGIGSPGLYQARGIVPISYTLFAFTLGVTLGMLIRRTVPAMAATLAIYAAAVVSMEEWIREHLVAASHVINPLDTSSLQALAFNPDNGDMTVIGSDNLPSAWVLSNQTITATGQVFTGPADPRYCSINTRPRGCEEWLGTLGLRQDLTYHPDSHFWSLQWAEAGIFVAAALLLVGFCFWWIRRRIS
jgi:hypothetical protein